MTERHGLIAFMGNPLTVMSQEVKVGDPAPPCTMLDNDLQPVELASYKGKILVVASVPSLDTPVCDIETRWFNDEAAKLGPNVEIVTVSMDLPFAQKRWCGASGVSRVRTLSDHRDAAFGMAFGTLIKELRLLARAVFILDTAGVIRYIQFVKEIAEEPNYAEVLQALKTIMG